MLVEIENVSKSFKKNGSAERFTALDQVSLGVAENEFVCLLGPSGCGKSTLLKQIAGLQNPDSGSITVNGKAVTRPLPEVNVVFQDYALFPWRNVRKNISIGLEIEHASKEDIRSKTDWAIKLVGLEDFAESYPYQLSGGMRQRVAIARALVLDSKVLLMDEPFGALDAFTRMNLQDDLINIWQKQKLSVIFVTHDVDEAVYLADKVVVMTASPGRIKRIFDIRMGRPRFRTSEEFNYLRSSILKEYGYEDTREIDYSI